MSSYPEEIASMIKNKYFFFNFPDSVENLDKYQLLQVYLRLLQVLDDNYVMDVALGPDLDHIYKHAQAPKHIIKCLTSLELFHLLGTVKPALQLLNKKIFMRVFSAVDDKITTRHGSSVMKRVRQILKREELARRTRIRKQQQLGQEEAAGEEPEKENIASSANTVTDVGVEATASALPAEVSKVPSTVVTVSSIDTALGAPVNEACPSTPQDIIVTVPKKGRELARTPVRPQGSTDLEEDEDEESETAREEQPSPTASTVSSSQLLDQSADTSSTSNYCPALAYQVPITDDAGDTDASMPGPDPPDTEVVPVTKITAVSSCDAPLLVASQSSAPDTTAEIIQDRNVIPSGRQIARTPVACGPLPSDSNVSSDGGSANATQVADSEVEVDSRSGVGTEVDRSRTPLSVKCFAQDGRSPRFVPIASEKDQEHVLKTVQGRALAKKASSQNFSDKLASVIDADPCVTSSGPGAVGADREAATPRGPDGNNTADLEVASELKSCSSVNLDSLILDPPSGFGPSDEGSLLADLSAEDTQDPSDGEDSTVEKDVNSTYIAEKSGKNQAISTTLVDSPEYLEVQKNQRLKTYHHNIDLPGNKRETFVVPREDPQTLRDRRRTFVIPSGISCQKLSVTPNTSREIIHPDTSNFEELSSPAGNVGVTFISSPRSSAAAGGGDLKTKVAGKRKVHKEDVAEVPSPSGLAAPGKPRKRGRAPASKLPPQHAEINTGSDGNSTAVTRAAEPSGVSEPREVVQGDLDDLLGDDTGEPSTGGDKNLQTDTKKMKVEVESLKLNIEIPSDDDSLSCASTPDLSIRRSRRQKEKKGVNYEESIVLSQSGDSATKSTRDNSGQENPDHALQKTTARRGGRGQGAASGMRDRSARRGLAVTTAAESHDTPPSPIHAEDENNEKVEASPQFPTESPLTAVPGSSTVTARRGRAGTARSAKQLKHKMLDADVDREDKDDSVDAQGHEKEDTLVESMDNVDSDDLNESDSVIFPRTRRSPANKLNYKKNGEALQKIDQDCESSKANGRKKTVAISKITVESNSADTEVPDDIPNLNKNNKRRATVKKSQKNKHTKLEKELSDESTDLQPIESKRSAVGRKVSNKKKLATRVEKEGIQVEAPAKSRRGASGKNVSKKRSVDSDEESKLSSPEAATEPLKADEGCSKRVRVGRRGQTKQLLPPPLVESSGADESPETPLKMTKRKRTAAKINNNKENDTSDLDNDDEDSPRKKLNVESTVGKQKVEDMVASTTNRAIRGGNKKKVQRSNVQASSPATVVGQVTPAASGLAGRGRRAAVGVTNADLEPPKTMAGRGREQRAVNMAEPSVSPKLSGKTTSKPAAAKKAVPAEAKAGRNSRSTKTAARTAASPTPAAAKSIVSKSPVIVRPSRATKSKAKELLAITVDESPVLPTKSRRRR